MVKNCDRGLENTVGYFWDLGFFRILFHWIVTLVSRALLGFCFIRLLHQYLAHFQDSLSLDCYVSILRSFRILVHWIVTLVSRRLLGFSFFGLFRQYLAHFQDSLFLDCCVSILRTFRTLFFLDCYVSISRTFRILFFLFVSLVSRTVLEFSYILLLRLYLVHFQDSL